MSLRWTIRFYGNNYDFNSLVYKSAELGGCIQTLCLRWMDLKNVDQIVTEVQFPLTLRNLDLSYTMLNIDQVLAFLIACPQVVKAKLSLKDITGSRVCIACKVLSSRGKFFKDIGMARKRSAYNEHTWLDDAQISFDDFC
ncbi:hypothetical protein IWW54_004383 [Coemansia sp. RSA 2705]|nr:hypothetical protein IWW54_004383 [Coemansia sp. RSA 2705]